jgi:multimeric flavodoxin WrbA
MPNKRVLVLKGSPRRKSNSSILADRVAAGAQAAGATVESFVLHTMDIKPCDGCYACQATDTSDCVIGDDMHTLYPKLRDADAIVVASPIYWFTMSAQTKLCIDRWFALESSQGSALRGKKFAFVLTYGDSDPVTSGAVNAMRTYQDMCRYLKAEIVGMVYGTAGEQVDIEEQPKLLEAAYKLGQTLGGANQQA